MEKIKVEQHGFTPHQLYKFYFFQQTIRYSLITL